MNIGIFSDCYLPTRNGVSTVVAQARAELVRRGHRVSLYTVAAPGDAGCRDPSGPIHRLPSLPFNPRIQLRLGLVPPRQIDAWVAAEQLDIIHTHTEFTLGRAGQAAAGALDLPTVHTLHTFYPAYRHYAPLGRLLPLRIVDSLVGRFLARCDMVACPSEKGRAYVAGCAPGVPAVIIPNGIAPGRFAPADAHGEARRAGRAALGIADAAPTVLFAGRLAPEKRVVELLHAVHPLLAADPAARAVFAGAGPQAALLQKLAGRAGVGRQVVLTGGVPWQDMPGIYTLADVFATASLSEIHPMTLIEAVSSGLPAVARRDPGIDSLILDGFNGFLVDSDAELTAGLAALLYNEGVRQRFGQHAAGVAAQLSIGAHVDCLEALYRQTIETHSRKATR